MIPATMLKGAVGSQVTAHLLAGGRPVWEMVRAVPGRVMIHPVRRGCAARTG